MIKAAKNTIFEARMSGYTSEGQGVCRYMGRAVFVKGALSGELWRVRVVKDAGGVIYGRGEECLEASGERTVPDCPYYSLCGGCDLRHMTYGEELRFKRGKVTDALRRIGGFSLEAEAVLPAESVQRYRNKAIYAVGLLDGHAVRGFYRSGTHQIVPVGRCLLQHEAADVIADAVIGWMEAHGVRAYDPETGGGSVRHIFIRTAKDGRAVCTLVSAGGLGGVSCTLGPALSAAYPKLTGVALCVNRAPGNAVLAGELHTLWGSADWRDTLCGSTFSIAPQAFYQINPAQAQRLYEKVLELAAPGAGDTVLDLYCGAGTISLALARTAGRVIGAEIVEEAVENARANALLNGRTNAEFICADAGEAARWLRERGEAPAVVVVDPPRKGMSPEAVSAVAAIGAERIVYVSCDCATLARDLKLFAALGYAPISASPVDMFPRTSHVECVIMMTYCGQKKK